MAQGVAHLIDNNGRIRLIASPALSEEDVDAINSGYRSRADVLRDSAAKSLAEVRDRLVRDRLAGLAWLIANDRMDVKLALPRDENGQLPRGIYHEKIGVFTDDDGNNVAFSGSSNETLGGLVDNIESIDVYWSWDDPHGRVLRKIEQFEALWRNASRGVEVVEFTEVTSEVLQKYRPSSPPRKDPLDDTFPASGIPCLPDTLTLRGYQERSATGNLGRACDRRHGARGRDRATGRVRATGSLPRVSGEGARWARRARA